MAIWLAYLLYFSLSFLLSNTNRLRIDCWWLEFWRCISEYTIRAKKSREKNNNASIYGNYWCNTCNSTCKIPCAWPKLFITLAWHTGPACIHRVCAVHSGIQLKRGEIAVKANSGKNEKKRKYANRYTMCCDGKKEKKIAKNLHKFLIIHRKYVCKLGNQLALHFEIQFFSAFLNFHMEISERKYDKLSNPNAWTVPRLICWMCII